MRKRTARKSIFDFEKDFDINLDDYVKPYEDVKKELEDHLYFIKNKIQEPYAWKVIHRQDKSLIYITFAKNRRVARTKAFHYFRDTLHPLFIGKEGYSSYLRLEGYHVPQLDQYAREAIIPIPELLKLDITIPCSCCGKQKFKLKDYENNRCFIIEGEGNVNPFTKGLLVCYDCKKKYFS